MKMFLLLLLILACVAIISYLPLLISQLKLRRMKKKLDMKVDLLKSVRFDLCVETRLCGEGGSQNSGPSFFDVVPHLDFALRAVLQLLSEE